MPEDHPEPAVSEEINPFEAPKSQMVVADASEAEVIRKRHIAHETSIKSAGILYWLGALFVVFFGAMLVFSGVSFFFADVQQSDPAMNSEFSIGAATVMGLGLVFLAIVQFWAGYALRKLNKKVKPAVGVFSGIGLLGFPFGTLINAYILYLVFSKKGKTVFSDDYKQVIEATPHIKYRTSIVVWILVGLILLAVGASIVVPLLTAALR